MDTLPVTNSSTVAQISYDEESKVLHITFKTGTRYRALRVPGEAWANFKKDVSKGKFWHQVIKRNYTVEKITDEVEAEELKGEKENL